MSLEGRAAERITFGVDSGAALTVFGKDVAAEYPSVQGHARPVRGPRERCGGEQSSPRLQRCKSTRSAAMSRTGAGVGRASQAGDA